MKKLLMIMLSALMMVTPCFAASQLVSINGKEVIIDIYEENGRKYIEPYYLDKLGYKYESDYYKDEDYNPIYNTITITKNNKTLILKKEKGDMIQTHITDCFGEDIDTYIPLETVLDYFEESIEFPAITDIKKIFLKQDDAIEEVSYFYKGDMAHVAQSISIQRDLEESAMNNLYIILLENLPEDKKQQLEQEQRDWEVYRTNEIERVRNLVYQRLGGRDDIAATASYLVSERYHELLIRFILNENI